MPAMLSAQQRMQLYKQEPMVESRFLDQFTWMSKRLTQRIRAPVFPIRRTMIYDFCQRTFLYEANSTERNADPEGPGRSALKNDSAISASRLCKTSSHTKAQS